MYNRIIIPSEKMWKIGLNAHAQHCGEKKKK